MYVFLLVKFIIFHLYEENKCHSNIFHADCKVREEDKESVIKHGASDGFDCPDTHSDGSEASLECLDGILTLKLSDSLTDKITNKCQC